MMRNVFTKEKGIKRRMTDWMSTDIKIMHSVKAEW
jgi:hypothetical protein